MKRRVKQYCKVTIFYIAIICSFFFLFCFFFFVIQYIYFITDCSEIVYLTSSSNTPYVEGYVIIKAARVSLYFSDYKDIKLTN